MENHMFFIWISGQAEKCTQEFVRRAIGGGWSNYTRGRVSRIYEKNGKLIVKGADTLLGEFPFEIEAAYRWFWRLQEYANEGTEELAQKLPCILRFLSFSLLRLTQN